MSLRGLPWVALLIVSCTQPPGPTPPAAPQRAISLSPGITETVAAIGAIDRLVAVGDYCLRPPSACAKPKVGHSLRPDLEGIVRLQPDLILIEATVQGPGTDLSRLSATAVLPWLSLDDVTGSTVRLGTLFGRPQAAEALAARLRQTLGRPEPATGPEVLMLIGYPDAGGTHWFIKPESLHGHLVSAAGGRAPQAIRGWSGPPKLTAEDLVRLDPQWVVVLAKASATSSAAITALKRLETLAAVRQGRLRSLTTPEVFTTGPSILELVPKLKAILQ